MKFFNKKASVDLGSSGHRSFFGRIGRDPKVDWTLSIIASFLVALIFVSISISRYFSYYSDVEEQVSVSKIKDLAVIDTKSLDLVLEKFEERDRLRKELIREYRGPGDPSI